MDVTLELERKNAVMVTKLLQVKIPQGNRNLGIFRTLPVSSRFPARMAEAPFLHVLEASIDGMPCRTDDVKAHFGSQNVTVYLQDKEAWLAPGMHSFRLVYEMTGMIGFGQDEDRIFWNVTGSGWERGVLASTCTLVPAEGAPLSHGKAYLGYAGSTDSPVDFAKTERDGRTCFVFTAKTRVMHGQHFSVGVAFPKGTVPEPALYRRKETPCSRACAPATASSPSSSASLCGGAGDALPRKSPPRLPKRLAGQGQPPGLSPAQRQYLANDCQPHSSSLVALFLRCTARAGAGSQAAPRRASEPSASSLPPKRSWSRYVLRSRLHGQSCSARWSSRRRTPMRWKR